MRYAITGGDGVFGAWFAKHLLETDKASRVVCIGRNPRKDEPFSLGIGENDPRYRYEQINIAFEQDRLIELFDEEQPDVIANFAAQAYATSWKKSAYYYRTNLGAVVDMCEVLKKRDYLKRFLQISTSELYGSVVLPAKEDHPVRPTSPYAVSKLAADMHLQTLFDGEGFPMNIVRPSNCYAPGQQLYRIIPRAVWCALTGNKLPLEGAGSPRKSFMHAKDLAEGISTIVEKGRIGDTYNIGPENPCTIRNLVSLVCGHTGVNYDDLVEVTPARKNEDSQYWINSDKMKSFGWSPKISLKDGIGQVVEWGHRYLNQLPAPKGFVLRA